MNDSDRNPWDDPEDDLASTSPAAPMPSPDPAPAPATAAPRPAAEPAVAKTNADHVATDPEIDPNRNRVVFIALGIFVVIALVGFLLSRGGDDETATNAGGNTPANGGVSQPGGGSTVPVQTAAIAGTEDPFSRTDDPTSLGKVPNGSIWNVQEGSTWGISGGQAYLSSPDPDPFHRNIAWVGSGFANGQMQVRMTKMAPQAGIVFRYTSECSYWSIESAPAAATWNVYKVENCKATQLDNTGYTAGGDGVTIGVKLSDTTVQVVINGAVVKEYQDSALAKNPGGVGMVVSGPMSDEARFDDFVAGGPDGQGILTADVGTLDDTTEAPPTTAAPG